MAQGLLALGPAREAAGAAGNGLSLQQQHFRATHGTSLRKLNLTGLVLGLLRPALQYDAHDFRNDIAGAPDDHRVADTHILAMHLADVVQRDVTYCHPADEHRLQSRYGRQGAGAAHLKFDTPDDRSSFLGRKLVRGGPPRGA